MTEQNQPLSAGQVPPPPAPQVPQPPAAQVPLAPAPAQPVAPAPQPQFAAPAQPAAPAAPGAQPGVQPAAPTTPSTPNPLLAAAKAQLTSLTLLKQGRVDDNILLAFRNSQFWIVNFTLLSLLYGWVFTNLVHTQLNIYEGKLKGSIFGGMNLGLDAGRWNLTFFISAMLVFLLLLLRVVLLGATFSALKSPQPFTSNANAYASSLTPQLPLVLGAAILLLIPVSFFYTLALLVLFVGCNASGALAEVLIFRSLSRVGDSQKLPVLSYAGYYALWLLASALAFYLYYLLLAEYLASFFRF